MILDLEERSEANTTIGEYGVILEPNMGMDNDTCAKQSIHDGVQAACSEGGDGQRDECGGHGPVGSIGILEDRCGDPTYRSKTQ